MELRKRATVDETKMIHNERTSKKAKLNTSTRRSHIEDFSGEVWFEVFTFFDGQSLINSFSHLNSSIESLLNDFRLPIHFNVGSSEFSIPHPLRFNQITSLKIDYSDIDSNRTIRLDSFVRLRSLSLINVNGDQLESTSQSAPNSLCQISIQSRCARHLTKILSTYFPAVRRVRLDSMEREFVVKSPPLDNTKSHIETLMLVGTIALVKLARLWSLVPNLRSLSLLNDGVHQCDYWIDENRISTQKFPSHLTSLHINICDDDMSFCNLERMIPPTVRHLTISGSVADDDFKDYLCFDNWTRLMSHCSNELQQIELDLSSYFDPSDLSGLQRTLSKFRKNPFFTNSTIQSRNFLITVRGSIRANVHK